MNLSEAPFAAQASALSTLMAVVTALTAAVVRKGAMDPEVFSRMLDELLGSGNEPTPAGQEMREAIVHMFKTIAREEAAQ